MFLASNLKLLRLKKELSQSDLANKLNISREKLNTYERGTQPPLEKLLEITSFFDISIDALIKRDLTKLNEKDLHNLEHGIDVEGNKIRLLTLTMDKEGKENIAVVNQKAQAGYSSGYADPQYFEQLPMFSVPFLERTKTYRCFQVSGDSMLPVKDGEWIIGSYVQNWRKIIPGKRYIVVLKHEGVVFKRVYPDIERHQLLLVSDNAIYEPYHIPLKDLIELWEFSSYWEQAHD